MELKLILLTIVVLCILIGIMINYNSSSLTFGTNLTTIGIIGYMLIIIFGGNSDKNK